MPGSTLRVGAIVAAGLASASAAPAAAQDSFPQVLAYPEVYPERIEPRDGGATSVLAVEQSSDGTVSCQVRDSSGDPALDSEACRLLVERAFPVFGEQLNGRAVSFRWLETSGKSLPNVRGGPIEIDFAPFLMNDDYPLEAIMAREHGTVVIAIQVSPEGRPISCRIATSSGSRVLDRRTCALALRRTTFIPAADGHGGRSAGTIYRRVEWRL